MITACAIAFLHIWLPLSSQADNRYTQFDNSVQQVLAMLSSGDYSNAIPLAEPTLLRGRELFKPDEPKLINFEVILALAYLHLDQWQDAQSILLAVVEASHEPSAWLRDAQFSLAMIAIQHGAAYEGNQRLRAALAVASSLPSTETATTILIRSSLAQSDLQLGNTSEALEITLQNLEAVRDGSTEDSHREELFNLRTLATIYRSLGDTKREDDVCARLLKISVSPTEKSDTELAVMARDRDRRFEAGDFKTALQLQQRINTRTAESLGKLPIPTAQGLQTISQIDYAAGDLQAAMNSFRQVFQLLRQAYDDSFAFMSESEKNEFASQLDSNLTLFYSMCFKFRETHPEWLTEMYNLVLWQKNLVSKGLRQDQELLASANDEVLLTLLRDLKSQRSQIAELSRANPAAPSLYSLRLSEYALQRRIADRLRQLSNASRPPPDVDGILTALRPEDAAVEVIRLQFNDGLGPTSHVLYLALVARGAAQRSLSLITLGDSETIESEQIRIKEEVNTRGTNKGGKILASEVWKSLAPSVRGAKRVYLSPAGVLNEGAFFAWRAEDNSFLLDHDDLELRPVSSTAVILNNTSPHGQSTALLIGNPDFNRAPVDTTVPAAANPLTSGCVDELGEALKCLPNSGRELQAIYGTLTRRGWEVPPPLENNYATKAAVLVSRHPRVLHLATHGFFVDLNNAGAEMDPLGLELQLENSGLYFAGANLTLQNKPASASDNGVLSSFEALNLDLDGTELVVLSACDTGLGQLTNADEVLGLRRSFQVAGARNVMMSLWSVDDPTTTELMTRFYEDWAVNGDAYIALRKAAREIKKEHASPYYWAPFVVYGSGYSPAGTVDVH